VARAARFDHLARMLRRLSITVFALLVGCASGSGARLDALDQRVHALEERNRELESRHAADTSRLAKVEKFLGPYMNQPAPPPEPDADAVYAVPIDGNPSRGPSVAPVTLVEAFDFACPYCYRVHPTVEQLLKDYNGKLRVVYKMFIVHPDTATRPAFAACAAARQGKYAEMEIQLWEEGFDKGGYSDELITRLAKDIGLDQARFKADLDGEACKKIIADDMALMQKLGVSGTPGFFVNGRFLGGAQPIERFKALIDEELEKAEAKIAAGTPVADYYQKFVVEAGKPEL
jgi:protein-disulfide isomerase